MDRAMRLVLAAGVTLMVCGLSFIAYLGYVRSHPPVAKAAGEQAMVGPDLVLPEFSLVDQEGTARDRRMLEGRVSVAWFMFTQCPLACPAMSIQMADLQKQLKGSGVRFAAFSLDPARDTPAALKEYGGRYGVDWSGWTFLTEPEAGRAKVKRTGWDIFTKELHQFAEERETRDGLGNPSMTIEHGLNFFLVGPDGKVLGWFNSSRPDEMASLRERALGAARYYDEKGALKSGEPSPSVR